LDREQTSRVCELSTAFVPYHIEDYSTWTTLYLTQKKTWTTLYNLNMKTTSARSKNYFKAKVMKKSLKNNKVKIVW
jgi:hypothetical protein